MTERYPLCREDELSDPGSRGFSLVLGEEVLELLVVKREGRIRAYRNRCPHTGVNLEWRPNQFLDPSEGYIQCATHGALFRIEDGFCLRGPCAGQSLQPLALLQEGEWLYFEDKKSRA
jgi:nitrite reductase/ring-hydroxylating ferredoxin subunit